MSQQIALVDDPATLADALSQVRDEVIGVDVERADSDRYYRRAALIQVGDADHCVLVDPLAIPEPQPLATMVRERFVVLHALENDLLPLDALGIEMPRVADTAIAAGLLGLPIGLGDLLEEVLGVRLETDKSRYQRADWSQRPLSEGMIEYAAGDVLHLPELWRAIDDRLDEAGRRSWYDEELAATIAATREDTRSWERTKGSARLDPSERAVLRALWEAREGLCRTHDIAPNRLLHDRTLLDLSRDPAPDVAALIARDPQRRRGPITDHGEVLHDAQERGLAAEPEPVPPRRRWDPEQRDAFDEMRSYRSGVADEIDLDPGLLCPSRQLRAAISAAPSTPDELADAGGLRPWQQDLLLDGLWEIWTTRADDGAVGPAEADDAA